MLGRIVSGMLALFAAAPAMAQTLVVSEKPDAVAVTLYRDPARGDGPIRQGWPGGYALVTETRTLQVPAGPVVIRFVGVSEGMMPETAIVTGLPRGVGEKNRDARLLGPATLVDAFLKRRVTVRRTNPATGKVTESEAVIQAGPEGGVVLSSDQGVEALGCSGLPESLRYSGVPADLASRPTLSVTSDSDAPRTVTVQLSYLAQGLDWSANYVAQLGKDDTVDLFGWMTVVNGGSQGFADASTSAVAGRLNKQRAAWLPRGPATELHLQCWPMGTTSDGVDVQDIGRFGIVQTMAPAPPLPPAPAMEIIVTGSRRAVAGMMAQQEELGDLKLYRVPEPVTVAALATKQVALLHRESVRMTRFYRGGFTAFRYQPGAERPASRPTRVVLRAENRADAGLGLPLPSGTVALFGDHEGQAVLLGESPLADRAVGDEVEFMPGDSSDVRYTVVARPADHRHQAFRIDVTNAHDAAVTFELPIPYLGAKGSAPLVSYKGLPTWRVRVPANGTAGLDLRIPLPR